MVHNFIFLHSDVNISDASEFLSLPALLTLQETNEKVAIKQCRVTLDAKNCKRWSMEIDIMRRLDNEFVIRAIEVPQDLRSPNGELPVLGMEYCAGGDLRKVGLYFRSMI